MTLKIRSTYYSCHHCNADFFPLTKVCSFPDLHLSFLKNLSYSYHYRMNIIFSSNRKKLPRIYKLLSAIPHKDFGIYTEIKCKKCRWRRGFMKEISDAYENIYLMEIDTMS